MIHVFGDCELDDARFELRRGGAVVKLEPKTFDVLAYLIGSPERVVSKDELLDAVWTGQNVSESVLPKCIAAVRRAVGDAPPRGAVIQTVHGRGYRFVAAVERRGDEPIAGTASFLTPFVGHREPMSRLRQALESAVVGRGRMVLLVGEPGIGKTRTAEELAAEARRRAALVLVGRAYEGDGAPAFWPWIQMLRTCGEAPPGRGGRAGAEGKMAAELIAALDGRVVTPGGNTVAEAEHARFRLFDGMAALFRRLSQGRPLVLVLDDAHWADEASLRLLGFLARGVTDMRTLVVATYRDVELRRGHPLGELLGALAREPACERLALRGFDAADTERLIAGVAGAPLPGAVSAAVHEMTEGNPFFIQEVVRLLTSAGAVDAAAALPLALPQSVRDAVGRRLDALSDPCNAVLRVAAVLGRDFDVRLLGRVVEIAAAALLEHLGEAVRAHVLDEVDAVPGRYRFHHSLIRQTLYDELNTLERARLHARAGAAIEAAYGADVEPVLDELAHHFFQAAPSGDPQRAIDYCWRAAARAQRLLAYEQAARQYERALQLLELYASPAAARRAEVLLAVGDAHAVAGASDRARAAFCRAAEIGRELQRPDILAQAALGYRGPGEMGTPADDALALLEEARGALGDRHPALRARLLSRLVGTPPYSDSLAVRDSMSREALSLARAAGDSATLRDALEARLWACLGPDRLDDRLAVARQLLELADIQHNPHMALLAHDAQFGTHLVRGDLAAADHALAAFTGIAEALRQPRFLFFATFYAGSRALAAGDLARAEQLFRDALLRGRGTVPYAHFMTTAQLYILLYLRGDDNDPQLERVFFGDMMALPYSWERALRSSLAFALHLRGERAAARREFEALAEGGFETLRRDEHWLAHMGTLSTVAVLLGDDVRAAQLYQLLLPYADLVIVHDLLRSVGGTVAATLGSLATLLGRYEDGERHFGQARAREIAIGGMTAVMDRPAYARLLLTRNGPGDRARALALLEEVGQGMARLGIRRNWQLTAIEDLGLLSEPPPAVRERAGRGRRITTKTSKNRQDSGAG